MAEIQELKIKAEFSNEMLEQIRMVMREELQAVNKTEPLIDEDSLEYKLQCQVEMGVITISEMEARLKQMWKLVRDTSTIASLPHDKAIDEQKMKAHQYARAYVDKLFVALSADGYIDDGEWSRRHESACRGLLEDHLEEFALTILKETRSQ